MRLSEDFLLNIKESNDIYDVISSYVPLKKSGTDYVCNCPFHSEKTPSCHIYMATQSFYCFGCGAAGDVINFIRLYEHLDYMESVKFLAQRAGIAMPDEEGDNGIKRRTRAYEMNREAGRFFHKYLYSPAGKEGLDYLYGRGLTDHTIRTYGLGYAPDTWDSLKKHMNSLGYSDSEMEEASLLSKSSKSGNYFDFFKYRVMFPFIDVRGNIVGFSGRVIGGEDNRKYLNTKATAVYNKSTFLYSLNHAKNAGESVLIMCEGNLDVISMYQAGFKNAVATCGTAITDSHARNIANLGFRKVILAYDSDAAGQKATARAMNILDKVGISANVLTMQGAKDPDEYIRKFGAERFRMLLEGSEDAINFQLDRCEMGLDLQTENGRATLLRRATEVLIQIPDPVTREVYLMRTAEKCHISADVLRVSVNRKQKNRQKMQKKKEFSNLVAHTVTAQQTAADASGMAGSSRTVRAQERLLCYFLSQPEQISKLADHLQPEQFTVPFYQKLFQLLLEHQQQESDGWISALGMQLTPQEMGTVSRLLNLKQTCPISPQEVQDCIQLLQTHLVQALDSDAALLELVAQKKKKNQAWQ